MAGVNGGSFLQSWEWGEVQGVFGVPYWRLATWGNECLTGAALVLKRALPSGQSWLYVPRGPVAREQQGVAPLYDKIANLAREQHALFVRAEPPRAPEGDAWRKADHDVQPRHTLFIDLKKSEEELLVGMHHKTRYNIRLAERKGVAVRFSREETDIESFLRLSREVSARAAFHFHPDDYYRALMRVLGRNGPLDWRAARAEMALAEYEGEVLAVHLLVSFGNTVTYVHGASSLRKRNLMSPHLLQWESIKRAKKHGFANYDLFGVAPPSAKVKEREGTDVSHPWAGITRFKEGFGGRRVSYPGTYDLAFNHFGYWLYTAARRLSQ